MAEIGQHPAGQEPPNVEVQANPSSSRTTGAGVQAPFQKGIFAPNRVLPVQNDANTGLSGMAQPTGVTVEDAVRGRNAGKNSSKAQLEAYLNKFDTNNDGQIDADELIELVRSYAAERSAKKTLIRVIVAMVIFGVLLLGALTGMTWGIVAALKDSKVKGGIMYDANNPDQVVQIAINDMSVSGGMLINPTAGNSSNATSGASTVLRTAPFVGTPQTFNSRVPVKTLMELKYLYIRGAGQVEVALIVHGVARVAQAGSTYGTVVHILTMAGTVTLDGTAIEFDELLAPIFVEAGFIVTSNRRSLQGGYETLGYFNHVEDETHFDPPSAGEPTPALPSGDFRMRIQIYEPCVIPLNASNDRCAYSGQAPPPAAPTDAGSSRRRLQGEGSDVAGTTTINGTRYMAHTETATSWNGSLRTVYEYAAHPGYVRVALVGNSTGTLQSWTQEVRMDSLAPATYFCGVNPFSAAASSILSGLATLVNATFIGFDEHFGRPARHFRLVVSQPDMGSLADSASSASTPAPATLTVDYWDSRSGDTPLGLEFNHPWIGLVMMNVTEYTQLVLFDIDPLEFVYPRADGANTSCTNDTAVPRLLSAFDVEGYHAGETATARRLTSVSGAADHYRRMMASADNSSGLSWYEALPEEQLCGGGEAYKYTVSVPPCSFAWALTGPSHVYPLYELSCSGNFEDLPIGIDGEVQCDTCPTHRNVEGCVTVSLGLQALLRDAVPGDSWFIKVAEKLSVSELESCLGYDSYDKFGYLNGYVTKTLGGVRTEASMQLSFNSGGVWIDSVVVSTSVAINAYIYSYWQPTGTWTFLQGHALWQHTPEPIPAPAINPAVFAYKGYSQYLVGCYNDDSTSHLMTLVESDTSMTATQCRAAAMAAGYRYFGIEIATHCYGTNDMAAVTSLGPGAYCTFACVDGSVCGGDSAISLYDSGFLGCFQDGGERRVQILLQASPLHMTLDMCRQAALRNGYEYYALQNGSQCYGTNDISRAVSFGPSDGCDMQCDGSPDVCGGSYANSLFSTVPEDAAEALYANTSPYISLGCYNDVASGSLMTPVGFNSSGMTVSACRQIAIEWGFHFFAVQNGSQCYGSSSLSKATSGGVSAECGDTALPIKNSGYLGCFRDDALSRAVPNLVFSDAAGMTPDSCRNNALANGYNLYAVQNGTDCYGASMGDAAPALELSAAIQLGPAYTCNVPCPGAPDVMCGGVLANSLYRAVGQPNSPPPPLQPPSAPHMPASPDASSD